MNLDRLRAVQAEEREADSLRALPDTFYRDVAAYIEELREQRAEAAEDAADPFGAADVRLLTDEIETAEEVAEAIYERRVGKLVKRASLAAAGMPADDTGMTTEEADLFEDLVAQIEDHRDDVLAAFDGGLGPGEDRTDVPEFTSRNEGADDANSGEGPEASSVDAGLPSEDQSTSSEDGGVATPDDRTSRGRAGSTDAPEPPPAHSGDADVDSVVDSDAGSDSSAQSDANRNHDVGAESEGGDRDESTEETTDGGEFVSDVESEPDPDTDRVTIRITRDVGEVFGVDERVYHLESEDVVTLPAANARPLLDRDAAEQIE